MTHTRVCVTRVGEPTAARGMRAHGPRAQAWAAAAVGQPGQHRLQRHAGERLSPPSRGTGVWQPGWSNSSAGKRNVICVRGLTSAASGSSRARPGPAKEHRLCHWAPSGVGTGRRSQPLREEEPPGESQRCAARRGEARLLCSAERRCPQPLPAAACLPAADGRGGHEGLSGEGLPSHDAAPGPEGGLAPRSLHPQHAGLGAGGLLPEDGLPERLRLDAIR